MFERMTKKELKEVHDFHMKGCDHIRACYAHMDAQQAEIDGLKETIGQMARDAVRTNTACMKVSADHAKQIDRLKGELEEANETSARYHVGWQNESRNFIAYIADAKAKSETLQSDLAAHALALKEAREVIEEQGNGAEWRKENEPENWEGCDDEALERLQAFLARPLSSYQQRAERLEAVAKAAAGHDEDALETALAILEGRGENCAE